MLSYEVEACISLGGTSDFDSPIRPASADGVSGELPTLTTANTLPDSFVKQRFLQLSKLKGSHGPQADAEGQCESRALQANDPFSSPKSPLPIADPKSGSRLVAIRLNLKRLSSAQGDLDWVSVPESTCICPTHESFNLSFSNKIVTLESQLSI